MTKTTIRPSLKKRIIGNGFFVIISPLFFLPVSSGTSTIPHLDKIFHLLFHLIVSLWFIYGREKLITAALISLSYGIIIELLQSLTATRSWELLDIVANILGMITAVILGGFWRGQFFR